MTMKKNLFARAWLSVAPWRCRPTRLRPLVRRAVAAVRAADRGVPTDHGDRTADHGVRAVVATAVVVAAAVAVRMAAAMPTTAVTMMVATPVPA